MISRLGKIGINTTFVVKKSNLKKILKGGSIDNCQNEIDKQIDDSKSNQQQWITLGKIIQNIPGKGIASIIGTIKNTSSVVVKVQLRDAAEKEYNFINNEKLKDLNGFIKYECYFECDGTKDYIESYSTMKELKICNAKGNGMGIIVMPYYKNGSLEDVIKSGNITITQLIEVIIQVLDVYYKAFIKSRFVHGDFFTKNILIDDGGKPIIIDFEKSRFDTNINALHTFWRDLDDLFGDIDRLYKYSFKGNELTSISRMIMIFRAYNYEPDDLKMTDISLALKNLK